MIEIVVYSITCAALVLACFSLMGSIKHVKNYRMYIINLTEALSASAESTQYSADIIAQQSRSLDIMHRYFALKRAGASEVELSYYLNDNLYKLEKASSAVLDKAEKHRQANRRMEKAMQRLWPFLSANKPTQGQ